MNRLALAGFPDGLRMRALEVFSRARTKQRDKTLPLPQFLGLN
jgi:hypothetical protein